VLYRKREGARRLHEHGVFARFRYNDLKSRIIGHVVLRRFHLPVSAFLSGLENQIDILPDLIVADVESKFMSAIVRAKKPDAI